VRLIYVHWQEKDTKIDPASKSRAVSATTNRKSLYCMSGLFGFLFASPWLLSSDMCQLFNLDSGFIPLTARFAPFGLKCNRRHYVSSLRTPLYSIR